jgi:hypothetical protein
MNSFTEDSERLPHFLGGAPVPARGAVRITLRFNGLVLQTWGCHAAYPWEIGDAAYAYCVLRGICVSELSACEVEVEYGDNRFMLKYSTKTWDFELYDLT